MKTLRRWNYNTKVYDDYTVPDDWSLPMFSDNMGEKINCANCGKEMTFGEGYTSMEIHTHRGFGYYVCESCYQDEWKRRREALWEDQK